jgi:hypothetical protein
LAFTALQSYRKDLAMSKARLLGTAAVFLLTMTSGHLALAADVEVETGGDVEVDVDRDRPGILPNGPLRDPAPDVYVETSPPEVNVDDADVEVEVDRD